MIGEVSWEPKKDERGPIRILFLFVPDPRVKIQKEVFSDLKREKQFLSKEI
jgi:hypothetical protein